MVTVPNLTGLTQTDAEAQLTRTGLVLGAVIKLSNGSVPSGNVISSTPPSGITVDSGSVVNLEVSSGPAQVSVPNLVGLAQSEVEALLKSVGLVTGNLSMASSTTVPAGSVTNTNPVAGTSVSPASAVSVEVSSGPAKVAVPNLVGLLQSEVEALLKSVGLVIGNVSTASSATVPAGSVTNTNPVAGTSVNPASAVSVEVSSGPVQVAVPNVVGLTRLAAEATLKNTGLEVGTVTREPNNVVPAGGASSSSPAPGTLVERASKVDLVESTGLKHGRGETTTRVILGLIALVLFGLFIYAIQGKSGVLTNLKDKEIARGLITFLIALTTVAIAVILVLSNILVSGSTDDEKRFDRGKQVLSTLMGILGTIVGFYYGSTAEPKAVQQSIAPKAIVQTLATRASATSLPDGTVSNLYPATTLLSTAGTPPLVWSVKPDLPAGLILDKSTGAITGTPTTAIAQTEFTFEMKDSAEPAVTLGPIFLTLQIKP